MKLLKLTSEQLKQCEALEDVTELHSHGPLEEGEAVPMHSHGRALYWLKSGAAVVTGMVSGLLKSGAAKAHHYYNAVLVEEGELHGWIAVEDGTQIRHVIGVEKVAVFGM